MLSKGSRLIKRCVVFKEKGEKQKGWHVARLFVRLNKGHVIFKNDALLLWMKSSFKKLWQSDALNCT